MKQMMTVKTEFTKTFRYSMEVNSETGEVIKIECLGEVKENTPKTVTKTKKIKNSEGSPHVILEPNKLCFNQSALELMNIEVGDKIDIAYEQHNKQLRPVLSVSDKGTKITKSLTTSCRGSKYDSLIKYGTEFDIIINNNKENSYILKSKEMEEMEKIEEEEVDSDLPFDCEIPDLDDLEDANVTEIDSNFFNI